MSTINGVDTDKWNAVKMRLKEQFKREPDVKSALFIIGVREVGSAPKNFTKEQKEDLMNVGFCAATKRSGYFRIRAVDTDGWPEWEQVQPLPVMNEREQETFIKNHIILYFEEEGLL